MASGSTTNYALPYPLDADPVNVAGDVEDLAVTIDSILREAIEDASARLITTATVSNGFSTPVYTDNNSLIGSLAFSLAQDIQSSASPQFVGLTLTGDAAVNGGDITTTATTFNLINTNATTLNIGQAATALSIGATTGTTTVRNDISLATGKVFKVNGTEVLSSTTLGSGVTASSLTSVGTIATGVWSGTAIAANKGGTGQTVYAVGDLLYASTTTALSKLADVATGNSLISGGVGIAPSWGKIGLTTHVSGTLPVANGGTGVATSTGTINNVLSESPTLTGTPLSTTAAVDTNTTQIATTAFVLAQASGANPLALGSVAQGISTRYSRQDHVHPTTGLGLTSGNLSQFAATTSAQLAGVISDETGYSVGAFAVFSISPALTGTPTSSTAAVDTNTTQIATTAFVIGQGYLKSSTASSTYAPISSPTFTGILSSQGTQIIMNSDVTGTPTENISFAVDRGTSANVDIRWNESTVAWEYTNDGTIYQAIGSGGGGTTGVGLDSVMFLGGM